MCDAWTLGCRHTVNSPVAIEAAQRTMCLYIVNVQYLQVLSAFCYYIIIFYPVCVSFSTSPSWSAGSPDLTNLGQLLKCKIFECCILVDYSQTKGFLLCHVAGFVIPLDVQIVK